MSDCGCRKLQIDASQDPVFSVDYVRASLSFSRLLLIWTILLFVVSGDELHFISSSRNSRALPFSEWINKTQDGIFLNHSSYLNGEVLLFRTKKSRYRTVPMMSNLNDDHSPTSKFTFESSLTFKEWLKRLYAQEKAVKVSVRSTEVVRPVILHLHASRDRFKAPIIIHADTFDSENSKKRPVDAAIFIESAKKLLPESIISLGWTPSSDHSTLNKLDWAQAFRLIEYVYDVHQPLILNMRLNDAIHSAEQLEWLLGIEKPSVYLVVKGEVTDFVDKWQPLSTLTALASGHKLLFDVDDSWRSRIRNVNPIKKGKRSVDPEQWHNLLFPNPYAMLSTSVVSSNGVAFLGWPNYLLISNKRPLKLPVNQRITGKVLFLAKRQIQEISPARRSGLLINLFEMDPSRLNSPDVQRSIQAYIGYDGRVSIENSNVPSFKTKRDPNRKRSSLASKSQDSLSRYGESAASQMPQWPCYGFDLNDKGWRVEMEVWFEECEESQLHFNTIKMNRSKSYEHYRTFLQLETPLATSKKSRNIAIGKVGDGAIDFLVQDLRHSGAYSIKKISIFPVLTTIIFVLLTSL